MVFICTSQLLWRCQNLWSRIFSDQSLLRDTTVITAQGFGKVNAVMFSVLLFWFFTDSSMDCNARMTRWLSFYTRTAHFLADFFAIIARLTLSSKRAMWSLKSSACDRRDFNFVGITEVLFFSPLVSLSPNFFVLYLFPEGFWSRNGLILKGMWELTSSLARRWQR